MRTLTLNQGAVMAGLFTLTAVACNSLVGLDDLTVREESGNGGDGSRGGSAGSGGGESGGTSGAGKGNDPLAGAGGEGEPPHGGECTTNRECTEKAAAELGAGGEGNDAAASVCIKAEGRCQPLLSEDCDGGTGDYLNDRAIL